MKILITGGAGFAGTHLACYLKKQHPDWQIASLDNLKRRGSELNLPRLKEAGVQFIHGDVRFQADLGSTGFDLLIDASAEPSATAGLDGGDNSYLVHSNLIGTYHCLEFCRRHKAAMLYLSSSRVYPVADLGRLNLAETDSRFILLAKQTLPGVSDRGISEHFPIHGAKTLYGASKYCSEQLIQEYVAFYGLRALINRCGVLTGPGQFGKTDQGFVVLWMARHFFKGELAYIGYKGEGKQVRDLLHVEDLAELSNLQIDCINNWKGEIYNVGGGPEISTSLSELTAACRQITGHVINIHQQIESRSGDIPLYLSDTQKVCSTFGWAPAKKLDHILKDIYIWLNVNQDHLRSILA